MSIEAVAITTICGTRRRFLLLAIDAQDILTTRLALHTSCICRALARRNGIHRIFHSLHLCTKVRPLDVLFHLQLRELLVLTTYFCERLSVQCVAPLLELAHKIELHGEWEVRERLRVDRVEVPVFGQEHVHVGILPLAFAVVATFVVHHRLRSFHRLCCVEVSRQARIRVDL